MSLHQSQNKFLHLGAKSIVTIIILGSAGQDTRVGWLRDRRAVVPPMITICAVWQTHKCKRTTPKGIFCSIKIAPGRT